MTDVSGNCSSGSHPLVQNTYDTSTLGTAGSTDFPVGQLTQSTATTYYTSTDYTNKSTVTQQFQHDQRGQSVATTLQVSVPSTWGVTNALPTYKQTQTYNNADQPMMTQTTAGASAGYTFSQAYDSTTGQLTGLSNNGTGVANLATRSFNTQGLASDVNFQTTTSTQLATDHFGFDGDLRPASTTATWQSGSGATGTIFSSSRAYDAVGNVTSVSNTQATISGLSGSGGSEVQNFCYDEQNRLVWSGNGGTQPGAGNGTCGSSTLANSLSGAGYSNSMAYTHLGQIWQGPLNGSGTAQQYLYCDSAHPHQLKGLYPTGTTCSNPTGATYTASYDAWGNVTSRTYNATTATLSYDVLDHLVAWNAGSTNQQWYAYDASGNRVLLRSTTGTGINMGNTYYYSLGGRIIGELTGITTQTTQFFLTDALGSVLATFSTLAGSAAVLGNQVYGPYGNQRYSKGPMGTAKGYTGQYADAAGLDYYNARYYDPVVGLFVSADTVQGNEQGLDPYAYVGENPETMTDPSGNMRICSDIAAGCSGLSGSGGGAIDFQPPRQNNGGNTGGSGGPIRPTTTQPAKPKGCTLSMAQCTKAENAKKNKIQGIQNRDTLLKLAVPGVNLVFDIIGFVKDLTTATGISKIIELIGGAISILGDVSSIVSQVATIFKWNNAQVLINTIGSVINLAAGLYKLARGVMHSPWGVLAQAAILTGFYALKAAFIEGDLALSAESIMSQIVEKATGLNLTKISQGIGSLFQSYLNFDQAQAASLTNETDNQYCQSNPSDCS